MRGIFLSDKVQILAILVSISLITSSFVFIVSIPRSFAQTTPDFSGFTTDELAQMLESQIFLLEDVGNVVDEAAVADITNKTTLDLRNKINNYVDAEELSPNFLKMIDAARNTLNNIDHFIDDNDENGANKMLKVTHNIIDAFKSSVSGQRGHQISEQIADELIVDADAILLDLEKRGRDLDPVLETFSSPLPMTESVWNRAENETSYLKGIALELQDRGVTFEVTVNSPPTLAYLTYFVVIPAVVSSIDLTIQTNAKLVADGHAPLNPYERLVVYFTGVAIYSGLALATDSALAGPALISSGRSIAALTDSSNFVPGFFADEAVEKIVHELGLTAFEMNLILGIRDIYGNKIVTGTFEDLNGNGIENAFDPGISDWNITLFKLGGPKLESILTDVDGLVFFTGLIDGNYTITVETQSGWFATTSIVKDIELESGHREHNNNDFGFFRPGEIHGMKFNDADEDGTKDAGEEGLSGWTIQLKNATTGTVIAATSTISDGSYTFTNLLADNYTIEEVQQSGYVQTYPASGNYDVTITSGANFTSLDFGNFEDFEPNTGPNVIGDPGFESGSVTVNAPEPRGYWGSTGTRFNGNVVVTTEDKHSGSYSLKITSSTSTAAYVYQYFDLGTSTYSYSFWYKASSGQGRGAIHTGWGPPPWFLGGVNNPTYAASIPLGYTDAAAFPMDGQWHKATVITSGTNQAWFLDGQQVYCGPGNTTVPTETTIGDGSNFAQGLPTLYVDDVSLVSGEEYQVSCS